MKTRLCITPGYLALHVQYVWDADMPWQLLLLVEVGYCLCEPQHSLIYVICHYLIQFASCLPKSTGDHRRLQACILQLHQLLAL